MSTRRYHAYQASFSCRTLVGHIAEYLAQRMHVKMEDLRLWAGANEEQSMRLMEDERATLEDLGIKDEDSILCEVIDLNAFNYYHAQHKMID